MFPAQILLNGAGFKSLLESFGDGHAGMDPVDIDIILQSLVGQGFGEICQSGIDGSPDHKITGRGSCKSTNDVDHSSFALFQVRPEKTGEPDRSVEFKGKGYY